MKLQAVPIAVFMCVVGNAGWAYAQSAAAQQQPTAAAAAAAAATIPPATKLEGFKPAAGSVMTIGYDDLQPVNGVTIDVRELKDQKGAAVRGLLVEVHESQYREERAFVDADELPDLIKGVDALLEVKTNPTPFKSFEVRYTTRGGLLIVAFNSGSSTGTRYAVQAGRITKAQVFFSASDTQKLRSSLDTAVQKLSSLPPLR